MMKSYTIFSLLMLLLSSGCEYLEPSASAQTDDAADSSEIPLTQIIVTDLVDGYGNVEAYQVEIDAPEQVNVGFGYDYNDLNYPLTPLANNVKILFVYEVGSNMMLKPADEGFGQDGIIEQMFVNRFLHTKGFFNVTGLETAADTDVSDYLDDPIEPGEYWLSPYDSLVIDGRPDLERFIMPVPKQQPLENFIP